MFRRAGCRRNNSTRDETIFRFWRRTPETAHGYQGATERRTAPKRNPETVKCEPSASSSPSLSCWPALRWLVRTDNSLPGVGTFAYSGSPIVASAPQPSSSLPADSRQTETPGKLPVRPSCFSYPCRNGCRVRHSGRSAEAQSEQVKFGRIRSSRPGPAGPVPFVAETSRSARRVRAPVRAPHGRDAGRIPKPFAAACMIMPPPPSKTTTCAKRCCAASARPACRPSRPNGCRRRNNPRSARPSPRSPSRRCNACSSRRTRLFNPIATRLGSVWAGSRSFTAMASHRLRDAPAIDHFLSRNAFCARADPVRGHLGAGDFLDLAGGQVPSSTLMRWPSRKLTMSCSRPTCPSSADDGSGQQRETAKQQNREKPDVRGRHG